jgi:hypothetical protein
MNKTSLAAFSRNRRFRSASSVLAATGTVIGLGIAMAAPANADVYRFTVDVEPYTHVMEPCGAVFTQTSATHEVKIVYRDDGFWRWVEHDTYIGTIEYQGETFKADDHQMHLRYYDHDGVPIGVLDGQGIKQVIPGAGVAIHDEGHLVFNDDTGATILESDKTISFEDPYDWDGDVCAALERR